MGCENLMRMITLAVVVPGRCSKCSRVEHQPLSWTLRPTTVSTIPISLISSGFPTGWRNTLLCGAGEGAFRLRNAGDAAGRSVADMH